MCQGVLPMILLVEVNLVYIRLLLTLNGLIPPHICACPKLEHGFPKSYVAVSIKTTKDLLCAQRRRKNDNEVLFHILNKFRWEVIVRFVDIGGIVDHHCLNFVLFCWYWWNCWPSLFKLCFVLLILVELLTITV